MTRCGEKNSHYCVVTNFLNPLLEEVNFWRRLERTIEWVTGRTPKPPYARRTPNLG